MSEVPLYSPLKGYDNQNRFGRTWASKSSCDSAPRSAPSAQRERVIYRQPTSPNPLYHRHNLVDRPRAMGFEIPSPGNSPPCGCTNQFRCERTWASKSSCDSAPRSAPSAHGNALDSHHIVAIVEFCGESMSRRREKIPPSLRKEDVRLPGKGNSNSHGARPVRLIITMMT